MEQLARDPVLCYFAVVGLVYELERHAGTLAIESLCVGQSDPHKYVMPAE